MAGRTVSTVAVAGHSTAADAIVTSSITSAPAAAAGAIALTAVRLAQLTEALVTAGALQAQR